MQTNEARELLLRYGSDDCTPEEKLLVEEWFRQLVETGEWTRDQEEKKHLQETMEARLLEQINKQKSAPIYKINSRKKIVWWAVAASVVLALGIGSFLFFNKQDAPPEIVQSQEQRFKNDVDPGKYKAKLTLSDGREIVLDSAALGELAKQGGTVVLNKDGKLVYRANANANEILYNTLSTAKGETYATVLADGSKVWLNSASSIKFPVSFVGSERKVEINGEAYFEVAVSSRPSPGGEGVVKRPFIVSVNGMEVQVLGTHFNINAYQDEVTLKTTLLEGSVKVVSSQSSVVIRPGEQAVAMNNGQLAISNNVNLDEVMAWKNGFFSFENADIQSIMRGVARWYDIEVVYGNTGINEKIHLEANRNTSLKNVLRVLELTSGLRFVIDGKKVTVMKQASP